MVAMILLAFGPLKSRALRLKDLTLENSPVLFNKFTKDTRPVIFVSFSGGRTSAYMCWWLIENLSHKFRFIFIFANTGMEHEETLIFVDKCDKAFGLNLVWVEPVISQTHGVGIRHKVVSFETACRDERYFEQLAMKEGLPCKTHPHCTERLKLKPMASYKKSIGFKSNSPTCVGISEDESDRMDWKALEKGSIIYPLIKWHPRTKAEIVTWWSKQPFDLQIPEHYGNCVTCWKKSLRKLATIAKHEPHYFDGFNRIEEKYSNVKAPEGPRVFFRENNTTKDILALAKTDFREFVEQDYEVQNRLIVTDIDPMDIDSSCGASCEIGHLNE